MRLTRRGWLADTIEDLRNETYRHLNATVDVTLRRTGGERFFCPVCEQPAAFAPMISPTGMRRWARCTRCGALERHRLQVIALRDHVLPRFADGTARVLHVAPERELAGLLRASAGEYRSGDFALGGVDLQLDLRALDLPDATVDILYASHVLEHVDRDRDALDEIRRVLAPGGVAVLPVPLIGERTVEYPEPNPLEAYHVRAPGYDYYDRYAEFFNRVDLVRSGDAPTSAQCHIFEDRSGWPTRRMPLRLPSAGRFHEDVVPLCWKAPA